MMFSSRIKNLLTNTGMLFIGNLGVKLISIFMVPMYTYVLSKGEYGSVDIITTTVTMLTPVVTLSVFDAVFRFAMNGDSNEEGYFTNGSFITLIGCLLTIGSSLLLSIILHNWLLLFVGVMVSLNATVSFLLNFSKGVGYLNIFTVSSIVFAILNALLNVWFLIFIKLSVLGYAYANIISSLITVVLIFMMGRYYRYTSVDKLSLNTIKEMLRYSIPLIPNSFAWWFTTDASRFFILMYLGTEQNGLYAVATKIPAMFTLFFGIFIQSWQISAIEEKNSKDRDSYYSSMYNLLISFSFVLTTIISVISPLIMRFFVNETYYQAWKLVPLLLLSATFSNISGLLGSTYIVFKRTREIFVTTILGMILNALFCLVLIPIIGLNGAGLASSIGFLLVMVFRIRNLQNLVNIRFNYLMLLNNVFSFILFCISLIMFSYDIKTIMLFGYIIICNVVFGIKHRNPI